MRLLICLILLGCICYEPLRAQCPASISVFPYQEDFELGMGNWQSGGTSNDWAWGHPQKAFIQSAGSGNKCWVTGGLTGSFYNNGERSYVISPCFNFSTLQHPTLSCKVYWEGENTYDGTVLQYSTDNGLSWQNVGQDNEPASCQTQNWYNTTSIINLATLANPKCGWSGSAMATSGSCVGGGGSGGWVTAKHCLSALAGFPSVRFRFAFGAGTTCNNFDGFAFDDFRILEAPALNVDFSWLCINGNQTYQFTTIATPCPGNFVWNFGDPASGTSNGTWEHFTDAVIRNVSEKRSGVVFLLWGRFAQQKEILIDRSKHHILKAAHPSPFSAYQGFFGCRHFSKTNDILQAEGQTPMEW